MTKQPRSFHIILLIFLALIVSSVVLFNTLCNGDFHGDESGWISSGYYYTELLLHRDWDGDKWECPACLTWGGINMNLGKWMFGIPLKVYQMRTGRYFQGYYEFKSPLEDNFKKGLVPPRDILLIARSIPAVFGVLCCLLVFLIGYLIYNEWGGIVAALLTIGNHLFVTYSTKAMTDAFYNFFLLSICLAGIFFVKATTLKNRIITTILGAVFTGLACSIKITGITVGFIFFSCLIIYMFCMGRDRVSQALLLLIGFCLSCLIVVWALNPYFWPIVSQDHRTQALLEKSQQVENKKDIYSNLILDSLKQHSSLMNSRIMQFPRMFFRWRNVYLNLKKTGGDWWLDARFTTLNRHLFVVFATFWGSFFFLGVGIVWTFQRLLASLQTKKIDPCAVALVYFLANYFFILAFMVLNWERYYLPTLLAGNILTAAGILQLAVWGYTGTIRLVRNLAK